MKRILGFTLTLTLFLALPAMAGSSKIITLKDGSTINGSIVGIDNGHYVVISPSFGEIKVKEDDIVNITSPELAAAPTMGQPGIPSLATTTSPGSAPYNDQMQAMQKKITSDPAVMSEIQSMLQDPEILSAFSNPAFLAAAQSGDMQTIQNSPELQRLMNSPKMQALTQKLQSQQ